MLEEEGLEESRYEEKTILWKWGVKEIPQSKHERIAANQKKEELLLVHSIFHSFRLHFLEDLYWNLPWRDGRDIFHNT